MPAILSRAPAILPGVPTILAVPAEQICIARLQSRARPAPTDHTTHTVMLPGKQNTVDTLFKRKLFYALR